MKTIGVLTSGGDAPGMNAALRAVVRTANTFDLNVIGISRGYQGLIEGDFSELSTRSVSNIIQRGGTRLKTARTDEFRDPEVRARSARNMLEAGIEALVVIGGDGSFMGGYLLSKEQGINVIGIPATIDNDLVGTDETIGYDTALNTATEAIDKIRDTADAHDRLFIVEVMGRDAGFIALETGLSVGAELILLPEALTHTEDVRSSLKSILKEHRRSSLVVVAEGEETGGAMKLADSLKNDFSKYEMRVCILGHVQRGGSPSAHDRVLASRLGYNAVKALIDGRDQVMVGVVNNKIVFTPLKKTWNKKKDIDLDMFEMSKVLR